MRPRLRNPAVEQVLTEARLQAAGEHDHTVGVSRELGHIDRRLTALIPLEEPGRAQLDEVAVTGRCGREQRQVEPVEPARGAPLVIVDDVRLATENRLDAVLARCGEQLDRTVHHAVVGETDRRLTERRRPLDERLDLARPVEQRILGVDVKVRAGRGHSRGSGTRRKPALRA
jgi:hypothetical protein